METILVDMDEVITNVDFVAKVEKYLGLKLDLSGQVGYYLQDLLGDQKDAFFEQFRKENIYENSVLAPGCYDVLKRLQEHYHVYICTDYIWREMLSSAGDNLRNKFNFLYEKLDFLDPKQYIFTADKSIVHGDIRIDDKVSNLMGAKKKLLFTAYHNKTLTDEELQQQGIVRVNNWEDIGRVLLEGYDYPETSPLSELNQMIQRLASEGTINKKMVSDGHHTFGDLYEERAYLFSTLCNSFPDLSWKSRKHYDEENDPMFNGDFIAGINTPRGIVTYHFKNKYWDLFKVAERERAFKYDGCGCDIKVLESLNDEKPKVKKKSIN